MPTDYKSHCDEDELHWVNFLVIGGFTIIVAYNIQALMNKSLNRDPFVRLTLISLLVSLSRK